MATMIPPALPTLTPAAAPCQRLFHHGLESIQLWVKRDDLLHPVVSGNKFRKLKYALTGLAPGSTVLSMGGPYSNHLHALAFAGRHLQLRTLALVRGEEQLTPTLADCRALGMELIFVSRSEYRCCRDDARYWRQCVAAAHLPAETLWLAEGGSSLAAVRGVSECINEIETELGFVPDTVLCASGTGATLAGLSLGLNGRGRAVGIAVLKNAGYLRADIDNWLAQAGCPQARYELLTDYHGGGYGKVSPELLKFCADFSEKCSLPLEPVYTGKVCYALVQLVRAGFFAPQERVVLVHSGGLQGARGQLSTPAVDRS